MSTARSLADSARWVHQAGIAALVASIASWAATLPALYGEVTSVPFILLASCAADLVALPLGLASWVKGPRILREPYAAEFHPSTRRAIQRGSDLGAVGFAFGLMHTIIGLLGGCFFLWHLATFRVAG